MKDGEFKVAGYIFTSAHEYKEAKHDEETIEFIKAKTDLNDLNKVIKLYHKLIERNSLKTVVGFVFLKELQERITEAGLISKENIPGIQVLDKAPEVSYSKIAFQELEQKHKTQMDDNKIKIRNSRIINVFLLLIIAAMILISIFSDRNNFSNYENKIIDKYSSWEEELNSREKVLEEREKALEGKTASDFFD